ncbi:uncharacterized protein LOC135632518 [Musa acuminata AAA Group]|uniref:uncharacterized protein LOC135632518 n=1 Tax=Musa acuminata AAA Group TaxID=214697 RepID=UPI0031D80688
MGIASKTIRRSLHAFFRSYQAFASTAALLVFPASAATLLAQSLDLSSPVLRTISSRLAFLFDAAGFPPSRFFSLVNIKLSQSIFTFVSTLPFTLTFLVAAKASVYRLAFSIVISVTDGSGGHLSILKALVLVKGRTATAMTLTLPASLGMAGIEALFQYRVIRPYRVGGTLHVSVIWEAFSIICMHSLLVVLDTIITCTFLESCQSGIRSSWRKSNDAVDMASEPKFSLHV